MANEIATDSAQTNPTGLSDPGVTGATPPGSVDDLLAIEDPQFAASMTELRDQVAKDTGNVEIEDLGLDEKHSAKPPSLKESLKRKWLIVRDKITIGVDRIAHLKGNLSHYASEGKTLVLIKGKAGVKSGLHAASVNTKAALSSFKSLPRKSKLLVLVTVVMGALSLIVLKLALGGKILPRIETHYLHSFAEVADAKFEFNADEEMEDFTDPIYHPEHVMLIDKVVVNLRPSAQSPSPMGLFEFYIEGSSSESAIEIKDREVEVRDLISRSLERMTYDDLSTTAGKNKAKLSLRKALNLILTKGRVRRVFFRNIVLKA